MFQPCVSPPPPGHGTLAGGDRSPLLTQSEIGIPWTLLSPFRAVPRRVKMCIRFLLCIRQLLQCILQKPSPRRFFLSLSLSLSLAVTEYANV